MTSYPSLREWERVGGVMWEEIDCGSVRVERGIHGMDERSSSGVNWKMGGT